MGAINHENVWKYGWFMILFYPQYSSFLSEAMHLFFRWTRIVFERNGEVVWSHHTSFRRFKPFSDGSLIFFWILEEMNILSFRCWCQLFFFVLDVFGRSGSRWGFSYERKTSPGDGLEHIIEFWEAIIPNLGCSFITLSLGRYLHIPSDEMLLE